MRKLRHFSAALALLSVWFLISAIPLPKLFSVTLGQNGPLRAGPNGRPAAADPPLLESGLQLLTVSVTSKGSAVPGLTSDRFQVLEDGVEQKISYFWADSRPITIGF